MRALVTGASGFIGRQVVPHLVAAGHEVHAIGRSAPTTNDGATWHRTDLLDHDATRRTVAIVAPEAVLHLAWFAVPGEYWTSPKNLDWVLASLQLAKDLAAAGARRLVVAGTCAEYDLAGGVCDEERTALHPATPYAKAKHGLHVALAGAAGTLGLDVAWARIFYLYGPHEPPPRLVSSVARALLAGEPAPVSRGRQVRDFLDVRDVGSALAALLVSDVAGPVNVASGRPVSIAEVAMTLGRLAGAPDLIRLGAIADRPGDPLVVVGDVRRLLEEVGWSPTIELEQGLEHALRWWSGEG